MLLSRAQAIPSTGIKAVMLKEWLATERGKKADVLENATLFPRKKHYLYCMWRIHSWLSQPMNVNSFKHECVCSGAKTDFLEGCPEGSKTNLRWYLYSKRGRKILQRRNTGLQAQLHEFNFHFLKVGPQRGQNQSSVFCLVERRCEIGVEWKKTSRT